MTQPRAVRTAVVVGRPPRLGLPRSGSLLTELSRAPLAMMSWLTRSRISSGHMPVSLMRPIRERCMFAASAADPLVGEGELKRRGAEPAALPRDGESGIPGLVHLAEILVRESSVAVNALGAGGERPGQRIGEGDQLRLALGPGKGIVQVHAMR